MRTTVTLEPDVAAQLETLMRERGLTFKAALNSTLRRGLTAPIRRRRFVQKTYNLGVPLIPLEHANRIAAALEDEEIIEKLRRGR